MRLQTLFQIRHLALAGCLLACVAAHKDKKEDLQENFVPHTFKQLVVNRMVFDYRLEDFMTMWNNRVGDQGVTDLVWWSDGCTHADDDPLGWDFKPACIRHDFAYWNFHTQGRLSHASRKKIDVRFKEDLYHLCEGYDHTKACRVTAKAYYLGARVSGFHERDRYLVMNAILAPMIADDTIPEIATAASENATTVSTTTTATATASAHGKLAHVGTDEKAAYMEWVGLMIKQLVKKLRSPGEDLTSLSQDLDAWILLLESERDQQKAVQSQDAYQLLSP